MKKLLLIATISTLFMMTECVHATTETQTFTQGMGITDWSNTFSVNQFNSSLGTLNDVILTFSGSSNISASLTNNGTGTASSIHFSGISLVDVNIGDMYSSEIDASLSNFKLNNVKSGSTATTGIKNTTATSDTQILNTDLSNWIGTNSIVGNMVTTTGFSIAGSNTTNLIANVTNYSGAMITVIYDYTAIPLSTISPAPEADSLSMMLFGLGLFVFIIRRKKAI